MNKKILDLDEYSELNTIWKAAKQLTSVSNQVDLEDLLSIDNNIQTCSEMSDKDIILSLKLH